MKKQKLKLGAAIVIAAALTSGLIFVACKKDKTHNSDGSATNANNKATKIKSRYYEASGKQVNALVKTFKQQSKNYAAKTSSLNIDSTVDLSLDSAEFLLEAAINYDFDYVTATLDSTWYEVSKYAFKLTENENGEKIISASELLNAYAAMQSDLSNKVTDRIKLKAIDIQAYTNDGGNGGYFEATIIAYDLGVHSTIRYCSTTSAFSPSSYYFLESVNTIYTDIYIPMAGALQTGVCFLVNNSSIFPSPLNLNPNAIEPFRESLTCQGPIGLKCWGVQDLYEQYFFNIGLPIHISSTQSQLNPNLPSVVNPDCAVYPGGPGSSYSSWSANNYFSGVQMTNYAQNTYNNLIAPNLVPGTQPFLLPGSVQVTFAFDNSTQGTPPNVAFTSKYWWNMSWRRANAACTILYE